MSSQAAGMSPGMSPAFNQWPNQDAPGPSMGSTKDENEDGVSIRPMRRRSYPIKGCGGCWVVC